jgi:hypothetical protein
MKKLKKSRYMFLVLGIGLVWFLGLDKSFFVETCNDCFSSWDIQQYRLFTIPLSEKVNEHKSLISCVAIDLGVPCQHRHLDRLHKQRWCGLLFCYLPCKSGIVRLSWDEKLYEQKNSDKIKALVSSNPRLPAEFYQRVLVEHDLEYWKQLQNELFL